MGRLGLPPSNFKLNVHRLRCLCTKSSLLEHAAGATGATGATGTGEVVSRTAARSPPPTRAGGQDDGSYTNSLKLLLGQLLDDSLSLRVVAVDPVCLCRAGNIRASIDLRFY